MGQKNQIQRILIVDDEEGIRESMAMLFEMEGFYVKTADNGASALLVAQAESFDVVVSDIRMPVCGGMELLHRLKTLPGPMPVVFLISGDSLQMGHDTITQGAKAVFCKPFSHRDLVTAIRELPPA